MAATFAGSKPSSSLIETSAEQFEIPRPTPVNREFPSEREEKKINEAPVVSRDERMDRSAFSRATKIYQSFTAGLDRSSFMTGSGELGYSRREKDEKIDDAEKERILNIIE